MSDQLKKIKIEGFRSIESSEIELNSLNFLTGPCGGGKSNALEFLDLVSNILKGRLQITVSRWGSPDSLLRFGRQTTPSLKGELQSENEGYFFEVRATPDNRMVFVSERLQINGIVLDFGSGHFESKVASNTKSELLENLKRVDIYHFCDTGKNARVRQMQSLNDNAYLRTDAGNLVAFLYLLQERFPREFAEIEKCVNITFPFFKGFSLKRAEFPEIKWLEEGSDTVLKAHQLSDGVLRFICLATLLLQPIEMLPPLILIDEPELGLDNQALGILAELIESVSQHSQLIVATQSSTLINEFSLENLIIVKKFRSPTKNLFSKPDPDGFNEWLGSYSLGELLDKNVI